MKKMQANSYKTNSAKNSCGSIVKKKSLASDYCGDAGGGLLAKTKQVAGKGSGEREMSRGGGGNDPDTNDSKNIFRTNF